MNEIQGTVNIGNDKITEGNTWESRKALTKTTK